MTPAQYADLQPGDVGTIRVKLCPRGRLRDDVGTHVNVEVPGFGFIFVPVGEIDVPSAPSRVLAALCGDHGRIQSAA